MSSGQLAKALGVVPEDRDAWNKLVNNPPLNSLCFHIFYMLTAGVADA